MQEKNPILEWDQRAACDTMKFGVTPINLTGLSHLEILLKHAPPTWQPFFNSAREEILHAMSLVKESSNATNKAIYPLPEDILRAFWACPLACLKVIIIGQDPYPGQLRSGHPKAVGMSFSTHRIIGEIPDSLRTIYKEMKRTVEDWESPGHGDLTSIARQGVLFFNTALTVESGSAGSHVGYWKAFTEKLMDYINIECSNVVFLLWGKHAQQAAKDVSGSKHLKLEAYHPSPMNEGKVGREFAGCDHFNQCNIYLVSKGKRPIDWRVT